jgi:hypothetical protein
MVNGELAPEFPGCENLRELYSQLTAHNSLPIPLPVNFSTRQLFNFALNLRHDH